eukprot:Macronucleus_6713.p1 GENE.Macronucleus_6713~~Macronucleus_6713.p1  ORF type:complete len:149 (+),score=63.15 Macronucleus_6713:1-447(+)
MRLVQPSMLLMQTPLRFFAVTRRFSKSHEWVDFDADTKQGKLGITKYAAEALGDIVHVDLPEDGASFSKGDSICAIESVKTAADVYMPCDGTVTRINEELEDEPQQISIAAEEEGWLMEFEIEDSSQLDELLDEDSYKAFLETVEDEH